jgi:glycosyltransferase involved in cell wall biosynthesis/O-antigen/teichoic acid export membrane protein
VRILVLTDREWTHPQGGGTGTNLLGQVRQWIERGHEVDVVACSYPGAAPVERLGPLTIHRVGGRSTVFPRVIWRGVRGRLPEADVVLEVVNGITFLTPLWLRVPRVALVHHVHHDHYLTELGRVRGGVAAHLLETLPLRHLYSGAPTLTISEASAADLVELGMPREHISVSYIGVDLERLRPAPERRAAEPTLLYLGRLKRYKRIELLLDVLEGCPGAVLEVVGDGDHREELEREVEARALSDRVRMHGFVSEDEKLRHLQRAWVNLTASSAEGWCLTVMEAAACETPSVALAVGGLPESIEDGQTGLLAREPAELVTQTRRLMGDGELRERLGRAAHDRAREFGWDRTASETLALLERERASEGGRLTLRERLGRSDTGRAAGLAAALMAGNAIALIFTVFFARLLGASGYGALGSLLAAFSILLVPGSALQATVAREVSAAAVTPGGEPGAGVRRWLRQLLAATVVVTALSVLARHQMAALLGVEQEWAAAAVIPSGALWLVLSVMRGALQGFQRYRLVGSSIVVEAAGRLVLGLLLYAAGLGVTGAFLGTTLSVVLVSVVLAAPLGRDLHAAGAAAPSVLGPSFRALMGKAWAPVLAFTLLAALQNIDVVFVKNRASDDAAGSYAAASVSAKAVIWIAVGLGLYLLPEAVRRTRTGLDARPVLARTIWLVGLVAVPMCAVYALAGRQVLSAVFGEDLTAAADALPLLGVAMSLLAWAYLSVQYLLAIGRISFVALLAATAALEAGLLAAVGAQLTDVATVLAALQLALAPAVFLLVLRSAGKRGPTATRGAPA